MPTNKLPKKGIVDSLIYLTQKFEKLQRSVCCSLTGSDIIPTGDTASRPSSPSSGQMYFDATLNIPIWYNGTNWVDATGTTA